MVPGSNKLLNSEVLYSQLQYVTPFQGGNYHNNGNIDNSIDFSDSFFNQWATGEKGDNMSNNWGKSLPYFTSHSKGMADCIPIFKNVSPFFLKS